MEEILSPESLLRTYLGRGPLFQLLSVSILVATFWGCYSAFARRNLPVAQIYFLAAVPSLLAALGAFLTFRNIEWCWTQQGIGDFGWASLMNCHHGLRFLYAGWICSGLIISIRLLSKLVHPNLSITIKSPIPPRS